MKYFVHFFFKHIANWLLADAVWSSSDDVEVLTFLPADQLTFWDLTAKFNVSTSDSTESGSIRWMLELD